jgi:hypothetical protein
MHEHACMMRSERSTASPEHDISNDNGKVAVALTANATRKQNHVLAYAVCCCVLQVHSR